MQERKKMACFTVPLATAVAASAVQAENLVRRRSRDGRGAIDCGNGEIMWLDCECERVRWMDEPANPAPQKGRT